MDDFKYGMTISEALQVLKDMDEDLLFEMADDLSRASNLYFHQRRTLGEHTVKLILYKNILGESTWIKTIVNCMFDVDNIKIKPDSRKMKADKIDNLMFTPYIDCEEKDKILENYKDCLEDGYPEISNFKDDLPKYINQLKSIYKRYVSDIIPMLADKNKHKKEEYDTKVRQIFEGELK